MKIQWKLIFASFGVLYFVLIVTSGAEETSSDAKLIEMKSGDSRKSGSSPKFLNFDDFKEKFNRGYASTLEEVHRRRIYIFRAIQVFVYSLLYKKKKSKSYLAINQYSDRTPRELWNIMMSDDQIDMYNSAYTNQRIALKEVETSEDESLVDTNGIEKEIEILREHKNEPGFNELAKAIDLDSLSKSRKRRDVDGEVYSENNESENPDVKVSGAKPSCSFMKKFSRLLDFKPKNKPAAEEASSLQDADHEIFIDHRADGCFFPPRDQGPRCSCSYAFATIALLEWAHCKATSKLTGFSEQYIVDCGNRVSKSLNGCRGGSLKKVGDFVNEFGLELQDNLPYAGQELECPFKTGTEDIGYMRIPDLKVEEFGSDQIDEMLIHSPVLINMKVNQLFFHYGGGVDTGEGCRETEGYQSALIVGSGRQNGETYWLIRNSFSPNWGEKGYYKLSKSSDCLAPAKQGYLLRPQFDSNEGKDINQNYDGLEVRKRKEQIVKSNLRLGKGKRKKRVSIIS